MVPTGLFSATLKQSLGRNLEVVCSPEKKIYPKREEYDLCMLPEPGFLKGLPATEDFLLPPLLLLNLV